MARMNISVQDSLKERMDLVAGEVNWSQVATEAFELKLGDLYLQRAKKDMQAVIDRLRASKRREETENFREGHERGVFWAKERASYGALMNLHGWWKARLVDRPDKRKPESWQEVVAAALGDDEFASFSKGGKRKGFVSLDSAIGCEPDDLPGLQADRSPDWMAGFANGASAVFELVRDEL